MSIDLLHGDCYELIKQIPDNSIDLVYVDIPYLYRNGGKGRSALSARMTNKKKFLSDIDDGIDYSIFQEFIRVCKKTYIYMVFKESVVRYHELFSAL